MVIAKGFPKNMGRGEAGFMAFHAFHTVSFPWPVFRTAMLDNQFAAGQSMRSTRHEMLIGTPRLSMSGHSARSQNQS
jgi:hypothetical protein